LSAFGHVLLQTSLDGQASGGQGGFSPLYPLTRVPLDPVGQYWSGHQWANAPALPLHFRPSTDKEHGEWKLDFT